MQSIEAVSKGEKIEIPLGQWRPLLPNFEDLENWLNLEQAFAETIKDKIENGTFLKTNVNRQMKEWSMKTKEKFERVAILRMEESLQYLDLQLKLSMKEESPDIMSCIQYLLQMDQLDITALMLLKRPQVVETIENITRYEVVIPEVCSSRMVHEALMLNESIKKNANSLLRKFRVLFRVPDEKSFAEVFSARRKRFLHKTMNMSKEEFDTLVDESMISIMKPSKKQHTK